MRRIYSNRARQSEQGGILLFLALILFIASTMLAGFALVTLRQDAGSFRVALQSLWLGDTIFPSPTPELPSESSLEAPLHIAEPLLDDREQFEKQLRAPLRAYYATKPEQLDEITVALPENDQHTAVVTYTLSTPDGAATTHTFFYDKSGKKKDGPYPTWEPGLLDNTQ